MHWLFGVILNTRISDASIAWCDPEVRTLGKDLTFPLWRAARFLGRKPKDPWRGASYCRSQPPSIIRSLSSRQIRPTNLTMTMNHISKRSDTMASQYSPHFEGLEVFRRWLSLLPGEMIKPQSATVQFLHKLDHCHFR